MLNRVYRLVDKQKISLHFEEPDKGKDFVVIRPTFLSICVADQRYYNFLRPRTVMKNKLPMALIHEAIGKVVYDPLGEYEKGSTVILIPNLSSSERNDVSGNYEKNALFRSSNCDGFMQELIYQPREAMVLVNSELPKEILSFTELLSVAVHAIKRFEKKSHSHKNTIGVWGDGSLAYLTTLLLSFLYPHSKICVFGKHLSKMEYFTFVKDENKHLITESLVDVSIDHAFECTGGTGSHDALNQIIELINPEGYISMLGVSEEPIEINTRLCLEKGLTLVGNSRSNKQDYLDAINAINAFKPMKGYLKNLVTSVVDIKSIDNIYDAFEKDRNKLWGKTILKWGI